MSRTIQELVETGIKSETVLTTDYSVIERIIETHFDLEPNSYELPCIEERGSGSGEFWEVSVGPRLPDKYDQKYIDAVKNKKPINYGTRAILCYLCFYGVIPSGNYMIDISW